MPHKIEVAKIVFFWNLPQGFRKYFFSKHGFGTCGDDVHAAPQPSPCVLHHFFSRQFQKIVYLQRFLIRVFITKYSYFK